MTKRHWGSVFLLGFAAEVAWAVENQFFNTFMFDRIIPDPMLVSVMVAFSAIVATVTSIGMGAFSDRVGRRRPFLLFGYLVWGFSIMLIPMAEFLRPPLLAAWILVILDGLMTFFGATAYDAAYNAYITDITQKQNRGRAQAVQSLGMWLSMLVVYGASGMVIESLGYDWFFSGVGVLVLLFGIGGGLLVDDRYHKEHILLQDEGVFRRIMQTFRREYLVQHRDFFMVLLAMGLWGMAFNICFPFLLIYLKHYLKLSLSHSTILMFTAILVGGIAASLPAGFMVDRLGRRRVAILMVLIESSSFFLFAMVKNIWLLGIFGTIWIAAQTAWLIAMGAWSKDLFPDTKRGEFAGYVTFFNVAFTMIPGPIIGGIVAKHWGIPAVINGQQGIIPTPVIFMVSAVLLLTAIIPVLLTRETGETG